MIRSLRLGALALSLALGACTPSVTRNNQLDDGGVPEDDGGVPQQGDGSVPLGKVSQTVVAPGTPMDAATKFQGADDGSRAPTVVYPAPGLLIPPNLNELEVQIQPQGATDLFEISFEGTYIDLKIYTVCNAVGGGCSLIPDDATWKLLSQQARGDTVTMKVRATQMAGGGVGSSAPQSVSFANEDMLGGLYYWAASSGGIYRYEFGRRGQKAESFYTPAQAGGVICVGCHALSRNGQKMAAGLNAPTPAPTLRVLDVATRKKLYDQGGGFSGGSNYEALTPDGTKVLSTETGGLTIHDTATGNTIGATLANANMPDISPDGKTVVFARSPSSCMLGFCITLSVQGASLFTVPFTGNGFGNPKQLVTGGGNNYYPSISPDGAWAVFNRAAGDSYDAPDAKVFVVNMNGGQPVDLTTANTLPAGAGNSWPKFAPFIHHFKGSTIMWISYSSRRPYGLRNLGDLSACGQMNAQGCPNAQIWVVPVDVGKIAGGTDPGYPPFWLPFQDPATGNHIPQWVETVARQPCMTGVDNSGCMQGEVCDNGECVPGVG